MPIISYDKKYDTLLYREENTPNSYGDDINSNIREIRDIETDELQGYVISNFLRLCKNRGGDYDEISSIIPVSDILKQCNLSL